MKPKTIRIWRGRLPHWEVEDGRYFLTVRLKGAIPIEGQERIRAKAEQLGQVEKNNEEAILRIQRQIFKEMEEWLHRSQNVMYLQTAAVAEMIVEAIEHRQEQGVWNIFEYVVMPNHLHLFFETADGRIKETMEGFKRWTATLANKLLHREGSFWQIECFDHWSRSHEEDERIVQYIRDNPSKAGLVHDDEEWAYVGHVRRT